MTAAGQNNDEHEEHANDLFQSNLSICNGIRITTLTLPQLPIPAYKKWPLLRIEEADKYTRVVKQFILLH